MRPSSGATVTGQRVTLESIKTAAEAKGLRAKVVQTAKGKDIVVTGPDGKRIFRAVYPQLGSQRRKTALQAILDKIAAR